MAIIKKFRIKSFKNVDPLLEVKNISISFEDRKILDNISFKINPGEILGLLGPNGAGKSTIFNLITGLLKPDYGKIYFGNKDATNFPIYTRTREFKVGYVPQYGGFFGDLTTYQNLKAVAEILIKDVVVLPIFYEMSWHIKKSIRPDWELILPQSFSPTASLDLSQAYFKKNASNNT